MTTVDMRESIMRVNMKKILLALALFPSLAVAAPSYAPTLPPGGLDANTQLWANTSTLNGKTLADWGVAIDTNTTTAGAAIPKTWININTGVAGLDATGNMTSDVFSPILTAAPVVSTTGQPLINVGRIPVYKTSGEATLGDPWQSPDALQIGGLPTQGWQANGSPINSTSRPGSLVVSGQPWGPYNAGALLNVLWGRGVDQQNGVSNLDWRQGAGQIPYPDGVAEYLGSYNSEAPIIAPAVFGPKQVTITPALTADQIAMLRVGMYIQTNITTSQVSTAQVTDWSGAKMPLVNLYYGNITGWTQNATNTVITVSDWDNYNMTTHTANLSPGSVSGDAIDTFWSNYGTPMVFIGADIGETVRNDFVTYDGTRGNDTGNNGHATSLSHTQGFAEHDFRYKSNKANDITFTGETFSVAQFVGPYYGSGSLTSGSYLMNLSGEIPNLLILDGGADASIIRAHSFYLHGQEGSFFPSGSTAGQSGTRQIQTNFAFTDWADSANEMNLISYQMGYGTGTGYANTSYHLGLQTDGDIMKPTTTGYNQGEIEWNPLGTNQGSIALCGISEKCGLIVNGNGAALAPNGMSVMAGGISGGNGLVIGTQIAGHAAPLGVYTNASDGNDPVEIYHGANSLMALTADGGLSVAGLFATGGDINSGGLLSAAKGQPLELQDAAGAYQDYLSVTSGGAFSTNGAALVVGALTASGLTSTGTITTAPGGSVTFAAPDASGVSAYTTVDDGANLAFHASNGAGSYANITAATFTSTAMSGTGNALVCVDANGKQFRGSPTSCN